MGTRAGKLDRRIVLLRPTGGQDEYGGVTRAFVDDAAVWAGLEPQKGDEGFAADQTTAKQVVILRIRYRENVGPKWGVRYDGAEYDIVDVTERGRREELVLTCYARDVTSGPT